MIDRSFQIIRFQIRGKEPKKLKAQFRIREIFPFSNERAQVGKIIWKIQPTVRGKSLSNGLGKANGFGLPASAYETHFSDKEDARNLRGITYPNQRHDELPELRHLRIPG